MKTSAPQADLTFATPEDSGFPYMLFFCVFGSLVAHAATFFLFQVVYPQRVTIPQPAPHVSLLTPSSPENIALLRRIEAEDPALVANDKPTAPPGLVTAHYQPSYASLHTAPLGPPVEKTQGVRFPPAEDRLAPIDAAKVAPAANATVPAKNTSITFADGLAGRALANNPGIVFAYHASAPVEATTLLIGVSNEGKVTYALIQHPSGDPALDELAIEHLRNVTFEAASAPVAWGFATFSWGGDAYAPASKAP
jgi:TonB family protein